MSSKTLNDFEIASSNESIKFIRGSDYGNYGTTNNSLINILQVNTILQDNAIEYSFYEGDSKELILERKNKI